MTTKTYTQRGNCARAARVALGKNAKLGVDFTISGDDKKFVWTATAKPAKTETAPKAKRVKGEARIENQPQMQRIISLCSRKTGATIADIAASLGGIEEHTVRGAISRLKGEGGIEFTTTQVGRKKVYRIGADAE